MNGYLVINPLDEARFERALKAAKNPMPLDGMMVFQVPAHERGIVTLVVGDSVTQWRMPEERFR